MTFFKRLDINKALSGKEKENFSEMLDIIHRILLNSKNGGQADVVNGLLEYISKNQDQEFIRHLNGVDMWGGSGAVWEVDIQDEESAERFEAKMVDLIDLMEQTGIMGRGIKPVRKLFVKNRHLRKRE